MLSVGKLKPGFMGGSPSEDNHNYILCMLQYVVVSFSVLLQPWIVLWHSNIYCTVPVVHVLVTCCYIIVILTITIIDTFENESEEDFVAFSAIRKSNTSMPVYLPLDSSCTIYCVI